MRSAARAGSVTTRQPRRIRPGDGSSVKEWNPTKRSWPSAVMSSGWVSGSDRLMLDPAGVNVWLSALPDRIGRTSKCDQWCRRAPAAPWFDAAAATVAPAMSRLAGTTAAASIFAVRRVIGSMGPRFQDARGTVTDQSYWRRPTGCRRRRAGRRRTRGGPRIRGRPRRVRHRCLARRPPRPPATAHRGCCAPRAREQCRRR